MSCKSIDSLYPAIAKGRLWTFKKDEGASWVEAGDTSADSFKGDIGMDAKK